MAPGDRLRGVGDVEDRHLLEDRVEHEEAAGGGVVGRRRRAARAAEVDGGEERGGEVRARGLHGHEHGVAAEHGAAGGEAAGQAHHAVHVRREEADRRPRRPARPRARRRARRPAPTGRHRPLLGRRRLEDDLARASEDVSARGDRHVGRPSAILRRRRRTRRARRGGAPGSCGDRAFVLRNPSRRVGRVYPWGRSTRGAAAPPPNRWPPRSPEFDPSVAERADPRAAHRPRRGPPQHRGGAAAHGGARALAPPREDRQGAGGPRALRPRGGPALQVRDHPGGPRPRRGAPGGEHAERGRAPGSPPPRRGPERLAELSEAWPEVTFSTLVESVEQVAEARPGVGSWTSTWAWDAPGSTWRRPTRSGPSRGPPGIASADSTPTTATASRRTSASARGCARLLRPARGARQRPAGGRPRPGGGRHRGTPFPAALQHVARDPPRLGAPRVPGTVVYHDLRSVEQPSTSTPSSPSPC